VATLRLRLETEAPTVPLQSVTEVLSNVRRVLRDLDRGLIGDPVIEWHLSDATMASPLVTDLQAVLPSNFNPTYPQLASRQLVAGLASVEEGTGAPPYFSESGLTALYAITQQFGRNGVRALTATDVAFPSITTTITSATGRHIEELREPRFRAIGSITGDLDMVSVHETQTFNVYERRTARRVPCRFDADDLEKVRQALGRPVRVSGVVHRNTRGDVVSIDKPTVDVLPDEERPLPDIRGLAPDFTGEMSVGEYVRWLRDA
jgi:hypothetical protein